MVSGGGEWWAVQGHVQTESYSGKCYWLKYEERLARHTATGARHTAAGARHTAAGARCVGLEQMNSTRTAAVKDSRVL